MPFAGRTAGRGDHRNGKLLQQGGLLCETGDHGSSESTDDPYAPGGSRQASQREDGQAGAKALLKECAKAVYSTHPKLPVKYGDVLIENLCGTGAKVIATADMKA